MTLLLVGLYDLPHQEGFAGKCNFKQQGEKSMLLAFLFLFSINEIDQKSMK